MTELDVQPPSQVCLVDLVKDESSTSDSSASSSLPIDVDHKAMTGIYPSNPQQHTYDDEIRQCDDLPDPTLTQTPRRSEMQSIQPSPPSPSTPLLYNPYTQHSYSPVRSQRRLSGIGISLSLENLRSALNQEFPLLMPQEEKKQEVGEASDGESDLDPDEKLALVAQQIRSEIRQSEMLELAAEAERAAEAGLESFMGRASTFGDDIAVMETKNLKHPAALKRNSTYSEGFLRQRPLPRLRPQRKKICVLALRAVDEVIPPLGEIHTHLRTHLARSGVDEETLMFQEVETNSDFSNGSRRAASSAFFKNFRSWVSKGSNLSIPPRHLTTDREAWQSRLSGMSRGRSLTPNSSVCQDVEDDDDDSDQHSVDSSVVGETLAAHIIPSPLSPKYRPMSPEIKVPSGLEWSMTAAAPGSSKGPTNPVHGSISLTDNIVPPPPHVHVVSANSFTLSPSFDAVESRGANKATVCFAMQTPEHVTPFALFDAIEEGESDSAARNPISWTSVSQSLLTPDIAGRKTPDTDFVTPVRLRDIRDIERDDSCDLMMRNDYHKSVFTSIGRPLMPRSSEAVLTSRSLDYSTNAPATFIKTSVNSELRQDAPASQSIASDFRNDFNIIFQPSMGSDSNDHGSMTKINIVDGHRSAPESCSVGTTAEKYTDRQNPIEKEFQLESYHQDVHNDDAKKYSSSNILPAIANRIEKREVNSIPNIPNDPSAQSAVQFVNTPANSLLDGEPESDADDRVQTLPAVTTDNRTDEESSWQPTKALNTTPNPVEPPTPPLRASCECLAPLSRSDVLESNLSQQDATEPGNDNTSHQIRRVSSCPSLADLAESDTISLGSPEHGITRSPSHRRQMTVWQSLGIENNISPGSSRRTIRSDSLQAAMDNVIANLSPPSCGSPKYPYISHAENNDFLNNYLYCSKPIEQWHALDVSPSFDETTQSVSVQCANFLFGSNCGGLTSFVTSLFPKRSSFENREVFTLNKDTYTEVDPDSWFNVAAERFDGALERLVGRAREHRNRFQAPSLKKKPPSVRRMVSPPDEHEEDSILYVRDKAPGIYSPPERGPEPSLSNRQFRIIYGMSREQFQERNSVASFNDRLLLEHAKEKQPNDPKRELMTSLSAITR